MRYIESSNTYYLSTVYPKDKNIEIHSSQNHVFISEKAVDKNAVELLLRDHMIYDSQLEGIDTKGITKKEILDTLQISSVELNEVLKTLNAFEMDGKFYKIQEDFMLDIVKSMLLLLANSGGNTKDAIVLDDILKQEDWKEILTENLLTETGKKVLGHILTEAYDLDESTKSEDPSELKYSRNIENIASLSARILLSELKSVKLEEFVQTYENSLMVLLDDSSYKGIIHPNILELNSKHNLMEKIKNHDLSILSDYLSINKDTLLEKDYCVSAIDYFSKGTDWRIAKK